jgi:hypothetical protein
MIEQIKELRVNIDGLMSIVKELKNKSSCDVQSCISCEQIISDEIKDCYKSLKLSKAWLGKCLQEIGEQTPYQNDGKRKTVEDIEQVSDKSLPITLKIQLNPLKPIGSSTRDMTHIESVDTLRQMIQDNIVKLSELIPEYSLERNNAFTNLCEARFHLGFELQRIKEEK